MAYDHHRFNNSVCHSDDCQCFCRADTERSGSRKGDASNSYISTGAGAGKYLRGAIDLDRPSAVVHQDAPTRRRTPERRPCADRRSRKQTERLATTHAHAAESAHSNQRQDHEGLMAERQDLSHKRRRRWLTSAQGWSASDNPGDIISNSDQTLKGILTHLKN